MDLSLKIDTVENINADKFDRYYFNPQKPLVIKGLAKNTDAGIVWSIQYFKEIVGDILIDVYDNSNRESAKSAFTVPDLKMKFSEYLDILARNEHTDLRIFLFDLFKYHDGLKKDFPCPEIFKGMLDNIGHMFFGGKGTTVRIHYDIDMSNVLHTHFGGRKRVVLIAPEYSSLLYCLPLNTYSLIDPDKPDYKKYPGLKYVKGYDFVLEHGDSLFMPSGYWHYMTYLESSFSVSYRRIGPSIKHPLQGLMNLGLYMPADKLLNKVMDDKWLHMKEQIAEKRIQKLVSEKEMFCEKWRTTNSKSVN